MKIIGVSIVGLAIASVLGAASAATEDSTSRDEDVIQEITVTGSRIVRKDYEASSPITSVSSDVIESTGAVTAEAALNQLPQFAIGANATNAGWGGTGQATLNLRGLGTNRNLILLDGRRLQPSDVLGWIDVNTIPLGIVQNVEIISGGASAVYGSDALAGVVNFQTDPRFEGVKVDSQYSIFEDGDGETLDTSLTVGGNFAEGRGNAVVSLSYTERKDVGYMDRSFFAAAEGGTDFRLPTGIYRPSVNPPSQAAVDAVFAQYGAPAGRVPAAAVLGYNDDGSLFAASNGPFNYRGPDGLLYNTGAQLNNLNQFSRLQVPLTRYSVYGRATYELTEKVAAFSQIYYTTYDSLVNAEAGNDAFDVPVTNPFISPDLAAILASRADPAAPFRWEKRFQEEAGPRNFDRTFDAYQLVAGLKGDIDSIDGSWEIHGSYGSTNKLERNQGSVLIDSLTALLNAPDGGASLCDGGYNPFGLTRLSEECRDFLVATPISETEFEQSVVEASLQGKLADLPMGELRFAAGATYRSNSYTYLPDRDLARGNVVGVFRTGPSSGRSEVVEGYAELSIPLLRDVFLARSLDVDVAYRHSDYDLAGGVDTYKADFSWRVIDPVRLRGGYQRAVRAPSVGELFVAPNVSIPVIGTVASGGGDPCHYLSQPRTGPNAEAVRALCLAQGVPAGLIDSFGNAQDEILATSSGNTNLKPEQADTLTFGVVWTSSFDRSWLSQLQLSADYYNIEIEDVIGTIGAPQVLPKCFNQDGSNPTLAAEHAYCALVSRDTSTGLITNVNLPTLNLGGYRTQGVDFQVDWTTYAGVSVNAVVSYVDKFEVQLEKGSAWLDYSRSVGSPSVSLPGSIPTWKAITRVQYRLRDVDLGVKWRFIDRMHSAAKVTNPSSTVPDVSSISYFDVYGSWQATDLVTVRGGINNVTDKGPPLVGTSAGSTQASTYDIFGRQYYFGLSLNF